MKIFLCILALCCTSCVVANKDMFVALGGKSSYKSRDFGVVTNLDKSFRDGTLAASAIAGLYYSAATAAAQEVTSQAALKEATKQNASNNALKEALGAQEVEKATFVPPQ